MSKKYEDADMLPDEDLPSYEDAIKEDTQPQQQHQPQQQQHQHQHQHNAHPGPSGMHAGVQPVPPPRPSANTGGKLRIPWTYPTGFFCPKCNNTGYKTKNGKSCKSCWRRFAPKNNVNMAPTGYSSYFQSSPIYPTYQPIGPMAPMQQRPLYVRPGDPRIGGMVCGNCRGTGRIRFILDEDICPLCNGLGRILNNR